VTDDIVVWCVGQFVCLSFFYLQSSKMAEWIEVLLWGSDLWGPKNIVLAVETLFSV